jgi:hypothetical protein
LIEEVGCVHFLVSEELVDVVVFDVPVGALIAGGFGGEEVYGGFTVIECLGERRGFLIGETSVVVGCWVGE